VETLKEIDATNTQILRTTKNDPKNLALLDDLIYDGMKLRAKASAVSLKFNRSLFKNSHTWQATTFVRTQKDGSQKVLYSDALLAPADGAW
jgi:hypothetical protein